MKLSDKGEFTAIFKSAMEVYDKALSLDALNIWWATMADISIEDFRKAMTRHITTSQFFPKPSDILSSFRKDDKPGAEEAWSMIPKNEYDSVVWTNDMAIAFGAASPLINDGDAIGARMAFKEVYERECAKNNPTKWTPSFGMDRSGREAVLQKAVSLKRLTAEQVINYMPDSDQLRQLYAPEKPMLENLDRIKQIISNKPTETEPEEHIDESVLIARVKAILKLTEPEGNN
jgi:hypothetical protein